MQAPVLHCAEIDPVSLFRVGSGAGKRCRVLARKNLQNQVSSGNAGGFECLDEAAHDPPADERVIGCIDRCGGYGRKLRRHVCGDEIVSRAVGENRQKDHDCVARYLREFRDQRLIGQIEKVGCL